MASNESTTKSNLKRPHPDNRKSDTNRKRQRSASRSRSRSRSPPRQRKRPGASSRILPTQSATLSTNSSAPAAPAGPQNITGVHNIVTSHYNS
ncbi:hypothetical protein LTS18_010381, partial [Coniosporium uncinatum]